MVRALLDVSKLEAGQLKLNRTECDLVALAREVADGFESVRTSRVLQLDSAGKTLMASVDRDLISRVLQNLMGNALKFAPDESVVRIILQTAGTAVQLSVVDTGAGIPPEHHKRIFEKFGQVQKDGPRVGTGLGLTFCRLAVEAHGGNIHVESEPSKGSTFRFELPPPT
jgi:two-component system sensor histidine kinase/response regulator